MTAEAKHILDDFQALPDTAKREVLAELVRISARINYPTVSDDELLSAATMSSLRMTSVKASEISRAW